MMPAFSRRAFLSTSLAGFSAGHLLGADVKSDEELKIPDDPTFQPTTLFLTWQRDPTTTMTVQWIGTRGETADTNVYFSDKPTGTFQSQATTPRPYPETDFKVYRAELTGLKPGTDYHFRVGKKSPTYRFRTMPAKATDTIQFISG